MNEVQFWILCSEGDTHTTNGNLDINYYNSLDAYLQDASTGRTTEHSMQGYAAEDGVVVDTTSTIFAGDFVAISRALVMEQILLYFTSHAV